MPSAQSMGFKCHALYNHAGLFEGMVNFRPEHEYTSWIWN